MLRRTNHNMVASFGTMLLAVATLTVPQPANAVLQLTVDNFETLTTGKSVFIKFFAPWYVALYCVFVLRRTVETETTCSSSI